MLSNLILNKYDTIPNKATIKIPGSRNAKIFFIPKISAENAASHVALGKGFRFSFKEGETMSDNEFAAIGGNESLIHIDFMVGSGEMDVDGVMEDGIIEPLMRSGEWAFNL